MCKCALRCAGCFSGQLNLQQMDHRVSDPHRRSALHSVFGKMKREHLDTLIVSDLSVIRWLTGFTGSSAKLLLGRQRCLLFTDFRYRDQVAAEVSIAETVVSSEEFAEELISGSYPLGGTVGLQADNLSWDEARTLSARLEPVATTVPVTAFFDDLRAVKNAVELMHLQRAAAISEEVFGMVLSMIDPDVSELEIAAEISYQHRMLGAEKDSFDPIVASGSRTAMPHARPTPAKFLPGELIVIDMGCVYEGYASDQTRTVALGKVSQEARMVYGIVEEAQKLGVRSARCGMSAAELDGVVREYIARHGYGEAFGHSLGHGVGLDVHEEPRISSRSNWRLAENMVFTIEPGIYLPGSFGVRIEDTVVLGRDGAVPLQDFTKELIEL